MEMFDKYLGNNHNIWENGLTNKTIFYIINDIVLPGWRNW